MPNEWTPLGATPVTPSATQGASNEWIPQGATPIQPSSPSLGDFVKNAVGDIGGMGSGLLNMLGGDISGQNGNSGLGIAANNAIQMGKGFVNDLANLEGFKSGNNQPFFDPSKSVFQPGGTNLQGTTWNPSNILQHVYQHPVNSFLDLLPLTDIPLKGETDAPLKLSDTVNVKNPGEQMGQAGANAGYQNIFDLIKRTGRPNIDAASNLTGADVVNPNNYGINSSILAPLRGTPELPKVATDIGNSIQQLIDTANKDPQGLHAADIVETKDAATAKSKNFAMNTPENKAWANYSGILQQFLKDKAPGYEEAANAYTKQIANASSKKGGSFVGFLEKAAGPSFLAYMLHRLLFSALSKGMGGQ